MVAFLSVTFFRTPLPSLYVLLCLGIIRPFPFLFFSSFVGILSSTAENTGSCVPQIPDDEMPEIACHGVARWSYTGKRKEKISIGI